MTHMCVSLVLLRSTNDDLSVARHRFLAAAPDAVLGISGATADTGLAALSDNHSIMTGPTRCMNSSSRHARMRAFAMSHGGALVHAGCNVMSTIHFLHCGRVLSPSRSRCEAAPLQGRGRRSCPTSSSTLPQRAPASGERNLRGVARPGRGTSVGSGSCSSLAIARPASEAKVRTVSGPKETTTLAVRSRLCIGPNPNSSQFALMSSAVHNAHTKGRVGVSLRRLRRMVSGLHPVMRASSR